MLKPISITANDFSKPIGEADHGAAMAREVFKTLHGFYGQLFLSKYQTGQVDAKGRDLGIQAARAIWGYELARFDVLTITTAIERVKVAHVEYPPNLPQFLAICEANKVRKTMPQASNAIGMSQELKSEYTRRARDAALTRLHSKMLEKTGYIPVQQNLSGLKLCIANAVACAGGDEAAELNRLDKMFDRCPA